MQRVPGSSDRRHGALFVVLGGFFVGNALLAELVGGKLFVLHTGARTWTLSCGIILWPIVFVVSDLVNEYFGRRGVRLLTLLGSALIVYAFGAIGLADRVPAAPFSPVSDVAFRQVFRQSQWIIIGSITAFLLAQLIDVSVFWAVRRRTGRRWLWLRATGSTIVSQLIDTFVVQFIGLYLPWRWGYTATDAPFTFGVYLNSASSGYLFKLLAAVGVTPLLYVFHFVIDRYLGRDVSDVVIEATARGEEAHAGTHRSRSTTR